MKKIILDQDKCIGCNTCCLIAPENFEMDQSIYKAKVKQQPTEINETIQTAIDSCPVSAISTVEEK